MTFVSQQGGLFTVVMYRAGCGIVINSNGNMKLKTVRELRDACSSIESAGA
jgi:hypothetical protein